MSAAKKLFTEEDLGVSPIKRCIPYDVEYVVLKNGFEFDREDGLGRDIWVYQDGNGDIWVCMTAPYITEGLKRPIGWPISECKRIDPLPWVV